jgi:hypothetical protein
LSLSGQSATDSINSSGLLKAHSGRTYLIKGTSKLHNATSCYFKFMDIYTSIYVYAGDMNGIVYFILSGFINSNQVICEGNQLITTCTRGVNL